MKGENMVKYLEVIRRLLHEFTTWVINKIPREENVNVDRLSKFASIAMPEPNPEEKEKKVLVEYLPQPSIEAKNDEVLETHLGTPEPCWMDPILAYLRDGVLSVDKKEARRILYRAANYTLVGGTLYKRSLSLPTTSVPVPKRRKKGP